MNVRQALLYHPEGRQFQVSRQPSQVLRQLERNLDVAALAEPVNVPAKGGLQADFLEQWRMQQVGQRSQLRRNLSDDRRVVLESLGQVGTPLLRFRFKRRQIHAQERQTLSRAVVQIPGDPAPFFVLHPQQSGGKLAQTLIGRVEYLRLPQHLHVFPPEFVGALADASFEILLRLLQRLDHGAPFAHIVNKSSGVNESPVLPQSV